MGGSATSEASRLADRQQRRTSTGPGGRSGRWSAPACQRLACRASSAPAAAASPHTHLEAIRETLGQVLEELRLEQTCSRAQRAIVQACAQHCWGCHHRQRYCQRQCQRGQRGSGGRSAGRWPPPRRPTRASSSRCHGALAPRASSRWHPRTCAPTRALWRDPATLRSTKRVWNSLRKISDGTQLGAQRWRAIAHERRGGPRRSCAGGKGAGC